MANTIAHTPISHQAIGRGLPMIPLDIHCYLTPLREHEYRFLDGVIEEIKILQAYG